MGKIGYGYGSERHLLHYFVRHRNTLNKAILHVIGDQGVIEWLDFGFSSKEPYDIEIKGLEFLTDTKYNEIKNQWKKFWPQGIHKVFLPVR